MALLDAISSSSLIPVTVAPSPAMLMLVLATTVVPVIAAAVVPPIIEASIVPPLMSAVSAIKLSILAIPSIYKSFHCAPELPIS